MIIDTFLIHLRHVIAICMRYFLILTLIRSIYMPNYSNIKSIILENEPVICTITLFV